MKNRVTFLLILTLCVGFVYAAPPERFANLGERQKKFCNEHYMPMLKIYETEGIAPAIEELERVVLLAEEQFGNSDFLNGVIWKEGQLRTGDLDEEWGMELFQLLLRRRHRLDPNRSITIPGRDYLLWGNIMWRYQNLGKIARAQKIALRLEEDLTIHKGLDMEHRFYPETGAIFTFLPDAKNRQFPVYEHQIPNRNREQTFKTKKDYLYYAYAYGIRYVAESAQSVGDWVKAAELHQWMINYADAYVREDNFRRIEVGKNMFDSSRYLSEIALIHGYPEEAAQIMTDFLQKNREHYHLSETERRRAQVLRAFYSLKSGTTTEADIEIANQAIEQLAKNAYRDRLETLEAILIKARVLYALGDSTAAWEIVNKQRSLAMEDVNPFIEIMVLDAAIDFALNEGGSHSELELWLVRALQHHRDTGNKIGELPLYEKYASYLMLQNHFAEAALIQAEAVRLSAALNLPSRASANRKLLDKMHSLIETPGQQIAGSNQTAENKKVPSISKQKPSEKSDGGKMAEEGTAATARSLVDLQPEESMSVALPGQAAYGRFYLHNPSSAHSSGTLMLRGSIQEPVWQNRNWLTVTANPELESTELSEVLSLNAGDSVVIDIAAIPQTEAAQIECIWSPSTDDTVLKNIWSYQTAASDKRTAVIDAHIVGANPFYLVPVHHMIQRTDNAEAEDVNFAIAASSPMRIEYFSTDGNLIAVDANGDADFLDQGDSIRIDRDRNNWPDISFAAGQSVSSFIMYIQNLTPNPPAESELTVSILKDGKWQPDAVDVVKHAGIE